MLRTTGYKKLKPYQFFKEGHKRNASWISWWKDLYKGEVLASPSTSTLLQK